MKGSSDQIVETLNVKFKDKLFLSQWFLARASQWTLDSLWTHFWLFLLRRTMLNTSIAQGGFKHRRVVQPKMSLAWRLRNSALGREMFPAHLYGAAAYGQEARQGMICVKEIMEEMELTECRLPHPLP